MIRSMTGYARAEQATLAGRLSWELRAVNHRYLDVQFKLPDEYRPLEPELRQLASAQLGRGKVEAGLRITRDGSSVTPLLIDDARLAVFAGALAMVATRLPGCAAPDPVQVLSWPGIVRSDPAATAAPVLEDALSLFRIALADFSETRAREGERTRHYLLERLDALAGLIEPLRDRALHVRDAWAERLRAKLADLGVDLDPARLAQEAVLAAQRMDIDEELARLGSHVIEVRDTLSRTEAVGRRLDFLMQELNREANTLSSKSQDAEMTRHAVEMKVIIEQMREQVQNIE